MLWQLQFAQVQAEVCSPIILRGLLVLMWWWSEPSHSQAPYGLSHLPRPPCSTHPCRDFKHS